MNSIIVLDTGVLGMLVHPAETGEPWECKTWLKKLVGGAALVCLPEIADYELRRELLRMKSSGSIRRLDELKTRLRDAPITTEAMLNAAELWAEARSAGKPTSDEKALDADAILAAQSRLLGQSGDPVIVATINVGHLCTIRGRTILAREFLTRNRVGSSRAGLFPADNGGHVMPTVTFDIPAGALSALLVADRIRE